MSRRERETNWFAFLADERLAEVAEESLLHAFATSKTFRAKADRDAWLDAALRQQPRLRRTSDRFVEAVMSRVHADDEFSSAPSVHEFRLFAPADAKPQAAAEPLLFPVTFPTLPRIQTPPTSNRAARVGWGIAAAAVLVLATLAILLNREEQQVAKSPAPTAPKIAEALPSKPVGVAKLTGSVNCVWDVPRVLGERLEPGSLRLLQGTAKITFDGGPVVELSGPATLEILDDKRAKLQHGRARTESAETPVGFTLETPTSRVVDQGADTELFVADDGATEICVHRGEVDFEQHAIDGAIADRWRIGIGGSKRVEPGARPASPPPKPGGAFKGVLSIDGKTREFTNRDDYEKARKEAMEAFERLRKQFLDGFGGVPQPDAPEGGFQGQININGERTDFGSAEAFENARKQIQEQLDQFQKNFLKPPPPGANTPGSPAKPGQPAGGFRGQISINGQKMEFDNPRSLLDAQRRLMEQLEQFQKQQQRR